MNIFALDWSPRIAAWYHCDLHVRKMPIEYAQLLCCQHQQSSLVEGLYKPTHRHHPIHHWVGCSADNYRWLYRLFVFVCDQYYFRFGQRLATQHKLEKVLRKVPDHLPEGKGLTPFYLAMPEAYHSEDPVTAYRRFYVEDKSYFANWTPPAVIPDWYNPTKEQVEQALKRAELKRGKPFKRKFTHIYSY